MHKVTSEIFTESNNLVESLGNGNALSKFLFKCPSYMIRRVACNEEIKYDEDNDLDIDREREEALFIEHGMSSELQFVGLQIWRGAFLLADYILSNPSLFTQQTILELGSGVGLTSIVASFVAKEVICTDIAAGGILKLIERNFTRNISYVKAKFHVKELNFLHKEWSNFVQHKINDVTVILAADVIYDDKITDGFVCTLAKLLNSKGSKIAYIALEKRYVFTISEMETVAPMYEEFLRCIKRQGLQWKIESVRLDFPSYFKYDRLKHMILLKIQDKNNIDILC